jgi:hypothetical protein
MININTETPHLLHVGFDCMHVHQHEHLHGV